MNREWERQSRFLMEVLGSMNLDACAVMSQDLVLGLDVTRDFEEEQGVPYICANLKDSEGNRLFPAYRVREFGGKKVGILAVTDPRMQHAKKKMPEGLEFTDPAQAVTEGVKALRGQEGCDAVVLLYGGRKEQATENCNTVEGIDLIFFGNATISQRVAAETEAGTPVYSAANRGKDFGEIVMTIKDDGSVELSPILIHELDKNYEDHVATKELVDAYQADAKERKQRAQLIEKLAKEYSETSVKETYLGSEICARCHQAEYDSFLQTSHAQAMASLQNEYQENNPECVSCHVTGWEKAGGYGLDKRNRDMLQDVQCEACHGYGTAHERDVKISQATMEAACLACHDETNSPEFDYESYWEKIKH